MIRKIYYFPVHIGSVKNLGVKCQKVFFWF